MENMTITNFIYLGGLLMDMFGENSSMETKFNL
jgi:hypothetical protein